MVWMVAALAGPATILADTVMGPWGKTGCLGWLNLSRFLPGRRAKREAALGPGIWPTVVGPGQRRCATTSRGVSNTASRNCQLPGETPAGSRRPLAGECLSVSFRNARSNRPIPRDSWRMFFT